jgi:hypothetical protein
MNPIFSYILFSIGLFFITDGKNILEFLSVQIVLHCYDFRVNVVAFQQDTRYVYAAVTLFDVSTGILLDM